MSNLNITEIKKEQAELLDNCLNYDISLKIDGTLIYFIDGKLHSPRCERSERFKHILNILKEANFPNCMGEMFLDEKGSNVFDVSKKENWNKVKFMPFDLLGIPQVYQERKELLDKKVKDLNNNFIVAVKRFKTFDEGWNFVLKNNCEGLMLRNNNNWYKCKLLKEVKMEIVEHEKGKDKGTFILKNGSRISGTSTQFVIQYTGIKNKGNKAIGEIEYAFLTKDNRFFQPRLRQISEEIKND